MSKLMQLDLSRRGFLKAGIGVGTLAATSRWNPSAANEPNVLNYLSWPGNADPYLVEAFEKANNCKIRIKEYVGGDQMMAVVNQSPPGTFDVVWPMRNICICSTRPTTR